MKTEQEAKKQVERILTRLFKRTPFDVGHWKAIARRLLDYIEITFMA